MMKEEFERLAGYEVSFDDYQKIIEPMYIATDLDKQEFVKCINKNRFALPTKKQLIDEMKKIAAHLFEICGRYTDYESMDELEKKAREFAKRFYHIDWDYDSKAWIYFNKGYEFPHLQRGCTYPKELVIGHDGVEYTRIELVTA